MIVIVKLSDEDVLHLCGRLTGNCVCVFVCTVICRSTVFVFWLLTFKSNFNLLLFCRYCTAQNTTQNYRDDGTTERLTHPTTAGQWEFILTAEIKTKKKKKNLLLSGVIAKICFKGRVHSALSYSHLIVCSVAPVPAVPPGVKLHKLLVHP